MTDLYLRRREMMNFDEYSIGTLKYWWSGADVPVYSSSQYHWKTRIPNLWPDVPLAAWDSKEKCYKLNASYYVVWDLNVGKFTLGNHWRIVFNMDFKRKNTTYGQYFLDLGSVTNAQKAIGFGFVFDSEGSRLSVNWKMQGNSSNPGSSIYFPDDLIPLDDNYHNLYGYIEMIDGNDGYDRTQLCLNNQIYTCDVQVPKVFYGPTWQPSKGYIGRGFSIDYDSDIKLYDLKIYQID